MLLYLLTALIAIRVKNIFIVLLFSTLSHLLCTIIAMIITGINTSEMLPFRMSIGLFIGLAFYFYENNYLKNKTNAAARKRAVTQWLIILTAVVGLFYAFLFYIGIQHGQKLLEQGRIHAALSAEEKAHIRRKVIMEEEGASVNIPEKRYFNPDKPRTMYPIQRGPTFAERLAREEQLDAEYDARMKKAMGEVSPWPGVTLLMATPFGDALHSGANTLVDAATTISIKLGTAPVQGYNARKEHGLFDGLGPEYDDYLLAADSPVEAWAKRGYIKSIMQNQERMQVLGMSGTAATIAAQII